MEPDVSNCSTVRLAYGKLLPSFYLAISAYLNRSVG